MDVKSISKPIVTEYKETGVVGFLSGTHIPENEFHLLIDGDKLTEKALDRIINLKEKNCEILFGTPNTGMPHIDLYALIIIKFLGFSTN